MTDVPLFSVEVGLRRWVITPVVPGQGISAAAAPRKEAKRNDYSWHASPHALLNCYSYYAQISIMELKAQGLSLDYPNKVFREIEKGMHRFVEPASPAVGLIIQENIVDDDQVAKFVNKLFPEVKV